MDLFTSLKRKYLWTGLVLEGLLLFYLIGGFFVLPWWIQGEIVSTAQETYNLEVNPEFEVSFNPFTFELRAANGQISDNRESILSFHSISADFEPTNSLFNWAWTVDRLQVDSLRVLVRRGKEGRMNWITILERTTEGKTEKEPQEANNTDSVGSGPFYLASLRLNDGHVLWEDHTSDPAAGVSLNRLSLRGDALQWPTSEPMDLQFTARTEDTGKINSKLTWHPDDPRVDARFTLNNLPLRLGNDYVRRYADAHWSSGQLDLSGHAVAKPQSRTVNFHSTLDIRNARMNHKSDTRLVGWNRLSVDTFALNTSTREVNVQGITLDQLYQRLVVADGYTTNFQHLLAENVTGGRDTGIVSLEETNGWTFSLGPTNIRSADINFRDDNVLGSFQTRMHDLGGTIGRVHSRDSQPASVHLEGEADRAGKVSIRGSVDPFNSTPRADVEVDFRNLSMVPLSPYVVKFAGYRVDQGKLRLNLKYRVQGRQFSGANHAVLHRFRLGERVSENAVFNLPFHLAIALLKDRNGMIDVEIPVEGDLSNPRVELGQVIRQAVASTFTSLVSSPFQFLANLVNAQPEQLRAVRFESGKLTISKKGETTIRKISEALKERPQLNLEIRPVWTPTDRKTLARRKTNTLLQKAGGDTGNLVRSRSSLEQVYLRSYSRSSMRELQEKHSREVKGQINEKFDEKAYTRNLYEKIVDQVEIPDPVLRKLARSRARNVRERLKSRGIEDERLYVLDVHRVELTNDKPVELPLSLRG